MNQANELYFKKVLMDGIQEMVFVMRVENDSEFYYDFLNKAAITKTILDDNVIGKSLGEVYPTETGRLLYEQYKKVVTSLETVSYEDSYELSKGKKYYTETTLTPIFNDRHECTHIVALVRDVTDKKWGESKLKEYWKKLNESNQRYRSMFHYNPNAVLSLDVQAQIKNGNTAFENITGYTVGEILDCSFISLIKSDDVNVAEEHFQTALTGEAVNFRMGMKKITGENLEFHVSFAPIIIQKKVVGVYAILRDITENVLLRKKYEESEQRFQIIAEYAQDLILLLDEKGRISYASPSHKNILGPNYGDYIGKFFFYNIHDEDKLIMEERITQSIKDGKPCRLQLRKRHHTKGWIWHDFQGTPVYNDQNEFVHMVCVSRDIQSQFEYETRLKHFAFHDSLTNLPNRRYFKQRLTQVLENYQEKNDGLAVMMMDIDHFKSINDTWGHDVGDEVIAEFGKRIRNSIRDIDIVARLGGDEFVVLIPEIGLKENIVAIAEKIHEAMHVPWRVNQEILDITTSMGISIASRKRATASSLLKNADEALYEAKQAGRDSYRIRE